MDASTNVFNVPALLTGCLMMLLCLIAQGSTVVLVMTKFKPRVHTLMVRNQSLAAHVYFFGAILMLLMSHLLQIFIWAKCLYWFCLLYTSDAADEGAWSTSTLYALSQQLYPSKGETP